MSSVVFDISMSLDGYITAAHQTAADPMGRDGLALHEWGSPDDPTGLAFGTKNMARYQAIIAGRVAYEHSLPWWGAHGPKSTDRTPVFVVTHEEPAESPENSVYDFVTDGIEEALRRARAVAGDGDVEILGGANLFRQFVEAGLVDEIVIHLVPVLFGDGTRLFDVMAIDHTRLETIDVVRSREATHLRYRVVTS